MLHRLVVYGLLVMALIFTAEMSLQDKLRPQREEQWIEIVFDKTPYTPYQDEYEKMLYPTVRISSPTGIGSGVVIQTKELKNQETEEPISSSFRSSVLQLYVLTAAHVVDKQSIVDIELYDSRVITASVVITDTTKDLALLCALCDLCGKGIYSARLAPKDYTPYLFSPVWAVGCSLGLKPRPSYGHITKSNESKKSNESQKSDSKDSKNSSDSIDFWEISAPVLPGNSGGPVYDARTFEVIGIAVWVKVYQYQLVTTMAGIVPIQQVYKFIESIEFMESNSKNPKNSTNSNNFLDKSNR